MKLFQAIVDRISKTEYIRSALEDQADLSAFKQRPTTRIIAGLGAIIVSYIIGWPLISVLGVMSAYAKEPLILAVGGPITYGLSHGVFLLGMYLVGYQYSKLFFRWAARVGVEKLIKIIGIPRRPQS